MNISIIIILSILTLISIPFVFIAMIFVSWSTTHVVLPWLVLMTVLLLYVYVWSNAMSYVKKRHFVKKKAQLIYISTFLVCGIGIGSFYGYDAYQNRFATVDSEIDVSEYMPFESEKIATLKDTSTLTLTSDFPTMDGATALYPVYSAITQAVYPTSTYSPYASIVLCSTTPIAYENLRNEVSDIIFVAGPSKLQQEDFAQANKEMVMTPIGKEAFVFFVNNDNTVDGLTTQQLKDIYSGKITNWKQVGGKDELIKAFQRPEGSGSQSALLRLMGDTKLMDAPEENVAEGMGGIISQTAMYQNRENAIGYSFRFFADEMLKNKEIKLLKVDGVYPSKENIRNGTYPIVSPFYAITLKTNTKENVAALLQWIQSAQGKEIIEKSGYVPY